MLLTLLLIWAERVKSFFFSWDTFRYHSIVLAFTVHMQYGHSL